MCGEQDATTTPVRCSAAIFWRIVAWPGSEHMYLQAIAQATPGNSPAAAATCSTSTVRAMFSPHQQTNTPILAMVYCSSTLRSSECDGRSAVFDL